MIPRRVHRMWFGPHRIPAEYVAFGEAWRALGWEVVDWTEHELGSLPNAELALEVMAGVHPVDAGGGIAETARWVQAADIIGYSLVAELGGIVANMDIEPLRDPGPDLVGVDAFVVVETEPWRSNAFMGGRPGHPFWREVVARLPERFHRLRGGHMNVVTGPHHLTTVWEELGPQLGVTTLGPVPFFPVHFDVEPYRTADRPADQYIVDHHWGHKHPERITR